MSKWPIQGLVQEGHAPDKSDTWGGSTDADRSQLISVILLVHRKHREEVHWMYRCDAPCTIEGCGGTNGVMKHSNMAKNLSAPDINQLTAHGIQPRIRERWTHQGLKSDPNVIGFNTRAQLPFAALQMYRMVAEVITCLLEDIPCATEELAELNIRLDNNYPEKGRMLVHR